MAGYDPQNIFARILRNELPALRVYEDDQVICIMDRFPQADGHVLVIPREAAETLFELSEASLEAVARVTKRVAAAVRQVTQAPGIRLAQFNGAAAGQTVPHFHFHIIPMQEAHGLRPHGRVEGDEARLAELAEQISAALRG
ncbi:HIT domain-containing protein [Imbroritus primus]|uniref:HIT domain-containing protein n=1 Tax=Imbroritus primus TaxID=3058603 RepID=A0ACD3SN24_9BURK|nr:HIT domain-containing protein [Burkholderiaceae bacterium PBA]